MIAGRRLREPLRSGSLSGAVSDERPGSSCIRICSGSFRTSCVLQFPKIEKKGDADGGAEGQGGSDKYDDVFFQAFDVEHGSHRAKVPPTIFDWESSSYNAAASLSVQHCGVLKKEEGIATCFVDTDVEHLNVFEYASYDVIKEKFARYTFGDSDRDGCRSFQ